MRSINVGLISEKNKLDSSGIFLSLLTVYIRPDAILYLVPNSVPITFAGQTYQPFWCKVNSIQQDARGGLEDVEVNVSNVTREMSAWVEQNEMRGVMVNLKTVNS